MKYRPLPVLLAVAGVLLAAGCGSEDDRADATLVVISPHNENIKLEFERAFKAYHVEEFGTTVAIEWRDVGGGTNTMLTHLRNVYSQAETSGIDVFWGGGQAPAMKLAAEGLLETLDIGDEFKANVPARFGGLPMYDEQGLWCGAAVSGFGFIYNARHLTGLGVAPPALWDDLGDKRFFGLVGLADPTKSGSASSTYEMIVQSAPTWPEGWAKLLAIMGNANSIYNGASRAANAVISEVAVATCIDFYGHERVVAHPKELVFVSPRGQTAFNPDPIAILKDPPHGELAKRFVAFVLSRRGQALWALPAGATDGPAEKTLYRQPIRKDVYTHYADRLTAGMTSPYQGDAGMELDTAMWATRSGVLNELVSAAAVHNGDGLKDARKKLIDTNFAAARLAEFNALPPNVTRANQIAGVANDLGDDAKRERIIADWRAFFREKYSKVAR